MHPPPPKSSVTTRHNHVLPTTPTAKALGSHTPRSLSRHRSVSPSYKSRTHNPDSPRPSELLYQKSVPSGNSSSRLHPDSQTPETGASSRSSGLQVLIREDFDTGIFGLHPQVPEVPNTGLHTPIPEESKAGSSSLGRVYASTGTSLDSLETRRTPPILANHDYLGVLQKPSYHSNASSQSCLSFYVPPTFDSERIESEHSGLSQLTLTESGKSVIQDTSLDYATAEAQRISKSVLEESIPDLQLPVLSASGTLDLGIAPGDFERKFGIGDPDPSFHRSFNSPVRGEPPDQVVVEQVGSFRVHHLRNDSLGELPYISTIEALSISPLQQSSSEASQGGTPVSGPINKLEVITTPSITLASGDITPSIVVLPGEYIRRRHSGSALRSQGHRDFGVSLQIIDHVPLKPPRITTEARVTSDRPPNTPESPFTLISRDQKKLKGKAQNSPSSLITFLSVISPTELCCEGSKRPKPPGKENPHGILPVESSGTRVMCFTHAYGDQHFSIPGVEVPINVLPPHIVELIGEGSPCLRSVQRIIKRDDRSILSLNN